MRIDSIDSLVSGLAAQIDWQREVIRELDATVDLQRREILRLSGAEKRLQEALITARNCLKRSGEDIACYHIDSCIRIFKEGQDNG